MTRAGGGPPDPESPAAALREPARLVSALLDTATTLVTVLDPDGRIVRFGRACETATGYVEREVVGRYVWDFLIPAEEVADVREVFRGLAAGEAPGARDHHWLRKDGGRILVQWSAVLLRDDQGAVERIVTTGHDVTEARRMRAALREGQAQYRFFFERIAEGVWRAQVSPPLPVDAAEDEQIRHVATRARLVECNEAMLRLSGCDEPAQLLGARLSDGFEPEDERTREFFGTFVRGGYRASDLESVERDRRGQERCFLNNLVGVVEDGRLTWIWGTRRDITERRHAEEAVRAARTQLAALVHASPVPIVGLRPTGEVVSWNRAAETMFGWTADEVMGQRLRNVPADMEDEFDGLRARVLAGNPFTAHETKRVRRDGTVLDVSISTAALYDGEGNADGIVAIYTDVTERRRAEEELRRSQEELRQSQKMEAVGRLAGGIAHDFNNLLTAILSYSEMLLAELPPDDAAREDLEQIRQAGTRAAELTNQLLAFSRRQLLQLRAVNLNEIVAGVDRLLRRLIGEDIELRLELAADLRLTRADPGQLEQVLVNLAVNSRDAMPAGGRLIIGTANAEVGEGAAARWGRVEPGAYVTLTVRDTGTGMAPAIRERIFEPFFTTKEQGKGSGLGLSTVYGIVKQVGGYIFVRSDEGAGSVFTIYLPVSDGVAEPVVPSVPAVPVRGSAETILLVEDEALVRNLTRDILVRNGYAVLEAADGVEALRAAREYDGVIHLMLTDVVMPRMGGRELVEQILPERPEMRVLYVSGYSEEAILRQGQLTPGIELLPKPFTPGVLTAKIREILDRDP